MRYVRKYVLEDVCVLEYMLVIGDFLKNMGCKSLDYYSSYNTLLSLLVMEPKVRMKLNDFWRCDVS